MIFSQKIFSVVNLNNEFQIIAERKAERKASLGDKKNSSKTLLDLLLEMSENGENLTDDDIREEVNTFMFAGHDTVGTSVSWILYALGWHPQYQVCFIYIYNFKLCVRKTNQEL